MADVADLLITGAQKSISENTPDFAKAIDDGSKIALRMEQAQKARREMEAKKQEIEMSKYSSLSEAIFKMDKIKDPSTQRLYQRNFLPKMASSLGLELDKGQLDFLSTPENRAKLSFIRSEAEAGRLKPEDIQALMKDPENLFPEMPIPREIIGEAGEAISEGLSKFLGRQSQERAKGLQDDKFEFKKKLDFDKFVQAQSKKVTQVMGKIKDAKDGVRLGKQALSEVLAQIERGETPNETKFNAAVRGIAKAFNKGAMTERDVADFKELQGFLGKGEAFVRNWLAGGVNEKIVRNLLEVTDTTAKILDKRTAESGQQIAPSFRSSAFPDREAEVRKLSGLDQALRPTFAPAGRQAQAPQPGKIPGYSAITADIFNSWEAAKQEKFAKKIGQTISDIKKTLGAK